jgi:NAD(P)-dependent dehydrogenase (short-subunit alcohol dehydrogenase family)
MAITGWTRWAAGVGLALGALVGTQALRRRSRRLDLYGKVVLITGGSRGLGFAAARRFVEEGADVAICARDRAELVRARNVLAQVAAEAKSGGRVPRILALRADVTQQRAAEWLVAETLLVFGRLDVLVNCAVEISIGPLEAMTTEDFEQAFQGIFFALYQPVMAVVPHMRANGAGRIVNVTSVSGKAPTPHSSTYVTGKFATTGFSSASTIELRKYGIRVSTVMPPPIRNGAWMNAGYKGEADDELSWFAGALGLPVISADPERAAKAIVEAARYGDAETMVSVISWLQARLHALFPELSISLNALADAHLLPPTPPGARAAPLVSGAEILATSQSPSVDRLARAGHDDAERYLQPLAGVRPPRKPD